MKKSTILKAVLSVALVALFCLSLAGCKPASRFTGKWSSVSTDGANYHPVILEFNSDGTATLNGNKAYYTVNSNDHTLRLSSNIFSYEECSYEFDGSKTLTISGAVTYHDINGTYEKVKK